jgi:TRAP-type mannitol/chloroaromatic compound transport system permease small subunit
MTADSTSYQATNATLIARIFSWSVLWIMVAFLVNNVLTNFIGLAGPGFDGGASILQITLYPIAFFVAATIVLKDRPLTLRADSDRISNINTFFIRAAFWAVLYVGLADAVISFIRVEGMLGGVFGEELANSLGLSNFRGMYLHMPLILLGVLTAFFTRTLGFTWLALLVVVAELLIVFSRFIFSYEQSFMADLVRFWYGALFLFASAYTLLEEGHVRVDVFYAGFTEKTKGLINAVATIFLGLTLCWTILIVGMGTKSSIINSPIMNFEVTQQGFGLYVKYMMAGFLGIFAISMMIQFASYFLDAVADFRGDPGKRVIEVQSAH